MALNKDVLGTALYNRRNSFNNKTIDELIAEHGTIEAARLAMCKADADEIINHFKNNAVVNANTFFAPEHAGPVTGTGTIT
ncbi:MAG: hypothetical protein IPP48_03435 [Chitinophagaceae bacterium]|nr:hypothetical protein [Chitinophagaceae bacterium]